MQERHSCGTKRSVVLVKVMQRRRRPKMEVGRKKDWRQIGTNKKEFKRTYDVFGRWVP